MDATCDAFLGGRVKVFQPKQGFRAGTDSILLAAALEADFSGHALEVGCGAGGALFPAAIRATQARFTGLEIDPDMVTLAARGINENGLTDRVDVVEASAASLPPDWQNRFDLVFSNPPFFEAGTIQNPGAGKSGAYLESLPLKDWINAMLFALRPKGTFVMVHRAADLARILAVLERQTGEITVLPVHSYPEAEAKRVLVRARKALRSGPMRLLEPRYLYTEKGGPRTDWALGLQQDANGIDWN
ncbi:MAG: methyltransferase domain-containing protein [Henriciella sp.]|nr:methyltransferase domain-containing protein [Henriciella sp.]